jgi:hypothetical protein
MGGEVRRRGEGRGVVRGREREERWREGEGWWVVVYGENRRSVMRWWEEERGVLGRGEERRREVELWWEREEEEKRSKEIRKRRKNISIIILLSLTWLHIFCLSSLLS